MPHYRNGQLARQGDLIAQIPSYPGAPEQVGILMQITSGADTCNGTVTPVARRYGNAGWYPAPSPYDQSVTLKDCLPVSINAAPAPEQPAEVVGARG